MRRMNPRDTAANMNRRRMIRRGGTYGPPLPEGAAEDGVERGIAAFIGCASLVRQFEFAQNVWVNDRNFHELTNERDPIIGDTTARSNTRFQSGRSGRKSLAFRRLPPCAAAPIFSFRASRRCISSRAHLFPRDNTRETRMAEAKIYVPPTDAMAPGRTYNQVHRPRKSRPAAGG